MAGRTTLQSSTVLAKRCKFMALCDAQAGQQPSEPVSPAEGDALTALKRFAATVRDPAA